MLNKNHDITHFLWLDMEMSGLDVNKNTILELAAIQTNTKLEEVAQFHEVFSADESVLNQMDDWNKTHHKKSGLLEKVKTSNINPAQGDEMFSKWIKSHFNPQVPVVIAGNSISQDRKFIEAYMPQTLSLLHYRMLDVTSFKLVFNSMFKKEFQKMNTHRALDDIRESIAELKFFLTFVNENNKA